MGQPQELSSIAEPPLDISAVRLVAGRAPIVSFLLSGPARVRVTVQRGNRGAALRSLTTAGRAGLNRVRIPGRAALRPGRYAVRIRAAGGSGVVVQAVRLTM